jgi:hypothetical protein
MPVLVNFGFVSAPDDEYDIAVRQQVQNLQRMEMFSISDRVFPHSWEALLARITLLLASNNLIIDIQRIHIIAAAICRKLRKCRARLSKRVAMRLKCLSLLKHCSMVLRTL